MIFFETVTGGTPVEVYGGLAACVGYLNGESSAGAVAFRNLDNDDERKRRLIGATRFIDRKRWKGTRNGADGTTLAFPRDDLLDVDGTTATNAEQLALVNQAVFELAALGAADPDVFSTADQGENIKSMGAGSAKLEFFSPTSPARGTASVLPTVIHELIGQWLAGGTAVIGLSVGGVATGTSPDTHFTDCDGYKRSEAF